jgi:phospholipase D1/2
VPLSSKEFQASAARSGPRRWLAYGLPVLGVGGLALAWHFFDLEALRSADRIAQLVEELRTSSFGAAYVLSGFAVGTLVFLPITALIVGTTLAFGPKLGFVYAVVGMGAAACSTYWAGRLLGAAAVERLTGRGVARVASHLRLHAFKASLVARLMPVGNFTAINLVAGSMQIPFRAFFFGTLVGAVPGILILTLFADGIMSAIRAPSLRQAAIALAAVVGLFALVYGLRRAFFRKSMPPPRAH